MIVVDNHTDFVSRTPILQKALYRHYLDIANKEEMLVKLEQNGFAPMVARYKKLNATINRLELYLGSLQFKCYQIAIKNLGKDANSFPQLQYNSWLNRAWKAEAKQKKLELQKTQLLKEMQEISEGVLRDIKIDEKDVMKSLLNKIKG